MAKKDNAPKEKPEKKYQSIRCSKCGVEFPDAIATSSEHSIVPFVWDDKVLCKDSPGDVRRKPRKRKDLGIFSP